MKSFRFMCVLMMIILLFLCAALDATAETNIDIVYAFQDDSVAYFKSNGLLGLIDKNGTILSEAIYDAAFPFNGNLAIVLQNSLYGLINREGETIVPCVCKYIVYCSQDDVYVLEYPYSAENGMIAHILDAQGNLLCALKDYFIDDVNYGQIQVSNRNGAGILSLFGEVLIPCKWEYADFIFDGWSAVTTIGDEKVNYCNMQGELMDEIGYEGASRFAQGYAVVCSNDKWHIIDTKGARYDDIEYDYAELWGHETEAIIIVMQNGLYGFVNCTTGARSELLWDDMEQFTEKRSVVEKDGLYGVVDLKGNLISKFWYQEAHNGYQESYLLVKRNDKYTYLDLDGNEICAPTFDYASIFSEGLASVSNNGYWSFINEEGVIVIDSFVYLDPLIYGYTVSYFFENGYCSLNGYNEWRNIYMNKKGEVVCAYGDFSTGL